MDPTLLWAIGLVLTALTLFVLEVFIPSGGLLGLCGSTALVCGIVMIFRINTTYGLVAALVALVALPFLFGGLLNVWARTPVGRLLRLDHRQRPLVAGRQADGTAAARADPLIGARGTALTDLRPVGVCMLEGRRHDCLAEGGVIQANTPVRVIGVDGMQIKVRVDA